MNLRLLKQKGFKLKLLYCENYLKRVKFKNSDFKGGT